MPGSFLIDLPHEKLACFFPTQKQLSLFSKNLTFSMCRFFSRDVLNKVFVLSLVLGSCLLSGSACEQQPQPNHLNIFMTLMCVHMHMLDHRSMCRLGMWPSPCITWIPVCPSGHQAYCPPCFPWLFLFLNYLREWRCLCISTEALGSSRILSGCGLGVVIQTDLPLYFAFFFCFSM